MPDSQVIVGDCIEVMRGMAARSVQVCVTSPPYWGLRTYIGDDKPEKQHEIGIEATPEVYIAKMVEVFREVRRVLRDDGVLFLNIGDSYAASSGSGKQGVTGQRADRTFTAEGNPARLGDGLKPKDLCMMPSRLALALQADGLYIRSMMPWVKRSAMPESCTDRPTSAVEYVFLLTKSARYYWDAEAARVQAAPATHMRDRYSRILEDDGPQSVRHDHETIVNSGGRNFRNSDLFYESLRVPHGAIFTRDEEGNIVPLALDVNPEPFPGAFCQACQVFYGKGSGRFRKHPDQEGKKHPVCPNCLTWDEWLSHFATFGRKLVTPLIKAATSEKGCCPECGAPWKRVVEREGSISKAVGKSAAKREQGLATAFSGYEDGSSAPSFRTVGWELGCAHGVEVPIFDSGEDSYVIPHDPIPCTCFDPFCGSGTVGVVAKQLGLSFVGIELNPEYARMAEQRIANPEPEPVVEDVEGQMELFEET